MLRRLLPAGAHALWADPSGHVVLSEVPYDVRWVGRSIGSIEERTGVRVAFVTRFGDAQLVTSSTVLQDGDLLHVFTRRDDVTRVEETFASEPKETE
jgi:trk system potassium uptake protein